MIRFWCLIKSCKNFVILSIFCLITNSNLMLYLHLIDQFLRLNDQYFSLPTIPYLFLIWWIFNTRVCQISYHAIPSRLLDAFKSFSSIAAVLGIVQGLLQFIWTSYWFYFGILSFTAVFTFFSSWLYSRNSWIMKEHR